MDQTRLDAIRARCERATPGPWYNGDGSVDRFFAGKNTVATKERVIVERATYNDDFDIQTYSDIEFIAHSREDIPYPLDRVAALEAESAEQKRLYQIGVNAGADAIRQIKAERDALESELLRISHELEAAEARCARLVRLLDESE